MNGKYRVRCDCSGRCPDHFFDSRADAVGWALDREEYPQEVFDPNGFLIYRTEAAEVEGTCLIVMAIRP